MSVRTVKLLHVEDDLLQQRLIAHHLKALSEVVFVITAVPSEELAMASFQQTKFDLVVLDYQLVQGDGVHLLGCLRELDPLIPIIAISGVATSEIAAKLVQAGADDYINKQQLNSATLAQSVRSSLRRANGVRKKIASRNSGELSPFAIRLSDLCAEYVRRMGADFLEQLDAIEQEMKRSRISAQELERLHDNAILRLEGMSNLEQGRMKLLARPLLFELLVRVYDDPAVNPG